MFHKELKKLAKKGQTAVEYIVLMAIIVSIIITLMKKVREYLLADIDTCTPQSTQVICAWKNMFDQQNAFRFFQVRGRKP